MPRLTRRLYEIGALSVAAILLAVMGWRLAHANGLLLANGQPLFGDFIAFWSAGRLALEGRVAEVHHEAAIYAQHLIAVPGLQVVAPWNSPPPFLLLASVLALAPFPVAALLFLTLSGAIYIVAARKVLPDTRALLFALTLPAALFHLGSVQTGLFIAGVSGLALVWLDKRPRAAGALIALLAIKPHLAILWPVFLILSKHWTAFVSAALATAALLLLAGLVFGFDSYVGFIDNLRAAQNLIGDERVAPDTFASVFGSLIGLGAPRTLAIGLHAASVLAALVTASAVFRSGDRAAQGAALCAATMLISPYLFFYDATLLALGGALLLRPRDRFETIAITAAWLAGLSLAVGQIITLPIVPTAAWLVLIAALRRIMPAGSAAPHPAPAPRM
jgi:alpha-1,2-mannosyltransferase